MITHPLLNSNGILSTLELFQVQNYPQHTRILDGHLWVPNWVKCFCTKKGTHIYPWSHSSCYIKGEAIYRGSPKGHFWGPFNDGQKGELENIFSLIIHAY